VKEELRDHKQPNIKKMSEQAQKTLDDMDQD